MDVSSVPSESKSNSSDFSIERLLRDDARTQREDVPSPSWLCCTRYRPPRLPRPASNHGHRSRRSGRHARVPFTAAQAAALEAAYARAPYLAPPALRALAAGLQLREDRIKIWFQNRRARERREKTGMVVPPYSVTLAPTAHTSQPTLMINTHNKHAWVPPATTDLPQKIDCQESFNNIEFDKETGDSQILAQSHLSSLYNQYSTVNENADISSGDERPETPLDIETIEE